MEGCDAGVADARITLGICIGKSEPISVATD